MRILLCLLVLLFSACRNGDKNPEQGTQSTDTVARMKEMILKFPDSSLLKEELIQFYRDKLNYDACIKETESILQKDSSDPRWYFILATLQFEKQDTATAIKTLENGLPERKNLIFLGSLYSMTANKNALLLSNKLLLPELAAKKEAYYIRGLYFSKSGNKQTAIQNFDSCLRESYTFMEAYREKFIAQYDLGRFGEALNTLDKALTIQNNYEEGHYFRGLCLEKLNRPKDAAAAYRLALAYDAGYTEAKEALKRLEPAANN